MPGRNKVRQMAEIFDPKLKSREQKIPIWFLYGELALKKEIETLKSRINDKDYIDNKANLKYKYEQLEASKHLQNDRRTYSRKIDEQLNELKMEKMELESMDISAIKPAVAIVSQPGITPSIPIEPNKIKVVLIGTCFGLFMGLLAAFFSHAMGALRKQEESSTSV